MNTIEAALLVLACVIACMLAFAWLVVFPTIGALYLLGYLA